jgi:hypothetical protein
MTPEKLCDLLFSTAVKDTERYQKQLKSLEGEIRNLIAAIRSAQDVEGKRLQSAKVGDVLVELFDPSGVSSKAANWGQIKTGQRQWSGAVRSCTRSSSRQAR